MTEELITAIQSYLALNLKEADCIKLLFKEKPIKKGDFFLAEGQECKYAGFVVKGVMRYYINHDRENICICARKQFYL